MNYSIIRCICALVIGVLLVAWPEAAILYLVITIGVLFLVPGLFSVFGYLIRGKQDGSSFPIAGIGRCPVCLNRIDCWMAKELLNQKTSISWGKFRYHLYFQYPVSKVLWL